MKKKNNNKKIMKMLTEKNITVSMGNRSGMSFSNDPIRLTFTLSRYKFVAKMFEGFKDVLEVGAGDGFKSPIVGQMCKNLTLCDVEKNNYHEFQRIKIKNYKYILNDFTKKKIQKKFDGIYLLDVFEHIEKKKENIFMKNIKKSLHKHGTLIVGMPTIDSQKYASKWSKIGHVNCKSKKQLRDFMRRHFNNVYLFSMNDEVLHTGFDQMSHYIFSIANSKK
tara:strand:- start:6422 stop:7084 length:663 start_codon:yes stop_codon:yes gene_type:complete